MTIDEKFAARIRAAIGKPDITEKKVIGGLGFMVNGKMVCGIHLGDLLLRVGAESRAALIKMPGAKPFQMGGRVSKGWLLVAPGAVQTPAALRKWIDAAMKHAEPRESKSKKAGGAKPSSQ